MTIDILPRLKSGDSQRRQSCDCVPERVPASPRLPRGTRLGFRRKHSHVGNFTGTNQPPIPPGLTISPQADTACPAAVSPVSTLKAERQKFQLRCALYPPPEGRGFTARLIKNFERRQQLGMLKQRQRRFWHRLRSCSRLQVQVKEWLSAPWAGSQAWS